MRSQKVTLGIALSMIGAVIGCSEHADPISGGTSGTFTSDGRAMSQMELTFYDDSPFVGSPIAYGAVRSDGTFQLVNDSRSESIELPAGAYRVTIQSLGAEAKIPAPLADPSKTSLRIDHQPPEPIRVKFPGLTKGM